MADTSLHQKRATELSDSRFPATRRDSPNLPLYLSNRLALPFYTSPLRNEERGVTMGGDRARPNLHPPAVGVFFTLSALPMPMCMHNTNAFQVSPSLSLPFALECFVLPPAISAFSPSDRVQGWARARSEFTKGAAEVGAIQT